MKLLDVGLAAIEDITKKLKDALNSMNTLRMLIEEVNVSANHELKDEDEEVNSIKLDSMNRFPPNCL